MKTLSWKAKDLHLFLLDIFAVIEVFDIPLAFWINLHSIFHTSKHYDVFSRSCSLGIWVFMMQSRIPNIGLLWDVNFNDLFTGSCMCFPSDDQDLVRVWRCDESVLYPAMDFKLSKITFTGSNSHCCVSRSNTSIFFGFLVLLLRPPKTFAASCACCTSVASVTENGRRASDDTPAGPPAMAEAVMRLVVEKKIPPSQVHYDQFYWDASSLRGAKRRSNPSEWLPPDGLLRFARNDECGVIASPSAVIARPRSGRGNPGLFLSNKISG